MRNLWIFINRYNAFFLFVIFFTIGIILTVKNNAYQRSVTFNSTNEVVGHAYEKLNVFKKYMNLGSVNDSLALENAKLNTALLALKNIDSAKNTVVKDTATHVQYTYLAARVIKNSITLRNNVITINKGALDGIESGMAVISAGRGVVGIIRDVSPHLATIESLLNKDAKISVSIKSTKALGSLVWGDRNSDYRTAYIKDVPNHFKVKLKDTVITSGFGSFPPGIQVGTISNRGISTGDNFLTIQINLFNDFSTLQYVYVIKDKFAEEEKALESKLPNEQ
ncbi:rod shape-determining protein MreC [Pedobacter cryoconitis]|uniref:Cell shape-determining protein MreC n=1 Tax=Pedobacter cryoconitis TaxID=188932 RepID=A0A7W8ZLM5_9SPHI|nr:rod shape-determining protein MreC [Pedobacter cryoconitis]MBB5636167.1 rod shape-determining protein MreC [Pedobacter cryoconitis]MBB6272915.1 rod shape-determining protein MreC [Pedobacter cryoconitis]